MWIFRLIMAFLIAGLVSRLMRSLAPRGAGSAPRTRDRERSSAHPGEPPGPGGVPEKDVIDVSYEDMP